MRRTMRRERRSGGGAVGRKGWRAGGGGGGAGAEGEAPGAGALCVLELFARRLGVDEVEFVGLVDRRLECVVAELSGEIDERGGRAGEGDGVPVRDDLGQVRAPVHD